MPTAQRTVVLVPGLMCDATFWGDQIDVLSRSRSVHVPRLHDHRSLAGMAATILAQTDGPLDVVGHSMGGRVALEVWAAAPDRVESLMVLDTGVHPVGPDEPVRRQVLLDLAAESGLTAVAEQWVPGMLHPDRVTDTELVREVTTMVTSYRPEQFAGQVAALLGRRDARPILATITCPTLVVCGSDDRWSPPEQLRSIADSIDGARYVEIADAGHMVAMERPAQVTEVLVDWLVDT